MKGLEKGQKKETPTHSSWSGLKEKLGKRSESYTLGTSSFPPA